MVQYTIRQHKFLYEVYLKFGSGRNVGETFAVNFLGVTIPSTIGSHKLVNKVSLLGHFWTRNPLKISVVFTEEKVDKTGARLGIFTTVVFECLA
jgi:hypothetical protein